MLLDTKDCEHEYFVLFNGIDYLFLAPDDESEYTKIIIITL